MFEEATKKKYRFESVRGNVTVEDLWDIPLTSNNGFCLDDLAKSLNRKLKEAEEESFVHKKSVAGAVLANKLELVKRVIQVKLGEIEEKETIAARKVKKEKILEILADKEDNSLRRKSSKDLMKMLDEL